MASTIDPPTTYIQPTDVPKRTSSHQATNPPSLGQYPRKYSKQQNMSLEATPSSRGTDRTPMLDGMAQFRSHAAQLPTTAGATSTSRTYPTRQPGVKPVSVASLSHTASSGTLEPVLETQKTWTAEKEKILLGPFDYLYGHPGKDIRAQLIGAFNAWLRVPEESLAVITKVVGMLHTASLLVDDVEDYSVLRRGAPVANSIFGTAQTINSANYVYFLALQQLSYLKNPTTLSIYTEELLNLHRGQGMDLYWRDSLTCPSEDDYLEMVGNKTGGLFRLAIKLMQAESPYSGKGSTIDGHADGGINCIPLVSTIGLLFQILDDLLNLSSPTYTARKGLCEDLTEGKFSFPVIHAIRADPSNRVLLNVLAQKTTDDEVKKYAVGYMEKVGSFDYTRDVIQKLEVEAHGLIADIETQIGGEAGKEGADGVREILGMLKTL